MNKLYHRRKVSKKLVGATMGLALAAIGYTGSAFADAITSSLPGNDYVAAQFFNREVQITDYGQELFGIFNISNISDVGGSTTYWYGNNGSGDGQLVGYFEGLTSAVDQTSSGGLSFTGGHGAIFNVPASTYSPGTSPNTKDFVNQICGGLAACMTNPWLTFDFVPGINDIYGAGANATLQAAFASASNVQSGFGYLSVTGGSAATIFDTNAFTFNNFAPADLKIQSEFVLASNDPSSSCNNNTSNGWGVCSTDPITAKTIPEPTSLALLGLGLASVAGFSRLKKSKSKSA